MYHTTTLRYVLMNIQFYPGVIDDYRDIDGQFFVIYDDGDSDWHDLHNVEYNILEPPPPPTAAADAGEDDDEEDAIEYTVVDEAVGDVNTDPDAEIEAADTSDEELSALLNDDDTPVEIDDDSGSVEEKAKNSDSILHTEEEEDDEATPLPDLEATPPKGRKRHHRRRH